MIQARIAALTLAAVTLGTAMCAVAQPPEDKQLLAGVRTMKAAFDIREGDARALLYRLRIIDETRSMLISQGVTPEFVITFRGQATKLVQSDLRELEPQERPIAKQIAAKLADLAGARGVAALEQCGVAVRDQGTKAENVLPQIRVVGNAWISLIAYQARGYAYIAP